MNTCYDCSKIKIIVPVHVPEFSVLPATTVKCFPYDRLSHDRCQGRPQGHFLYPHTHLHYLTKPVLAMWPCFGVVQWMVSDWVWGWLCESTRLGQAYKNKPPHPKLTVCINTRSCRKTNACVCPDWHVTE